MFIPVVQIIILLNYVDRDLSGGYFHFQYYMIYFRITLFFLTSLVALLVGTGMYRDEINDNNIIYMMTRPLNRSRIFISKLAAYLVVTFIIVTPGIIASHFTMEIAARMYDTEFTLGITYSIYNLGLELVAAYIVLTGLGAVFITTGLWLKRPLLVNLLISFSFIIEQFLLDLISDRFEPYQIAQNLVSKEIRGFGTLTEFQRDISRFVIFDVSPLEGILNFLIILILTIIIGLNVAQRKEFP